MVVPVMDNTKATGRQFGAAICRHFGLPPGQVDADIRVLTDRDDIFGVTLTIHLTADDLAGIAKELKNGPPSISGPSPTQ